MNVFLSDLRAKQVLYSQYGPPCSLVKAIASDGTFANALYRLQGALARWHLAPVALVVHVINKWFNGCVIGVRASFGPGFVLIHPIGIVINSSARGGRNVWVESGVVIGDNRGKSPVIGDDVFIGSGAKIIGGVQIGSGARVGANAVVLHDVPAGVTVVGIPARPLPPRESPERNPTS
jgi:serine O-acetyltransferase